MRHLLGRFAGDSKPLKTSAGTWVNAGARKVASVLLFDWRKPEVATKAMLSFLSFLVFGPLIVLVFDTLLFAAGFGLVRFKIAGNGCGEGDLARAVTGETGAFAGAFFFPSSAAGFCDFDGLLTGEGVVVACCARGARFGVTGAFFGGSSTAFTPDGLGCVAALLDGATKSTALSMTVSSNPLGAAVAPHNSLRKNSVTLESDRFAP